MTLTKPAAVDITSFDSWAIPLDGVVPLSPAHAAEQSYLPSAQPAEERELVRLDFAPIWDATPSEGFHPRLLRFGRAA